MSSHTTDRQPVASSSRWLKNYYFLRFGVSAAWVAAALIVGRTMPLIGATVLIAYPAWDALANYLDAERSGGILNNKSQTMNLIVSLLTAAAVAVALGQGMNDVLFVFGIWATLADLLQLATAVRRWKSHGAQWAMILSGAQSALAGGFMINTAFGLAPAGIADIAPYAAFGAFYFLVSAIWLTVSDARNGRPGISA